jgi:hypothetical protein
MAMPYKGYVAEIGSFIDFHGFTPCSEGFEKGGAGSQG